MNPFEFHIWRWWKFYIKDKYKYNCITVRLSDECVEQLHDIKGSPKTYLNMSSLIASIVEPEVDSMHKLMKKHGDI